MIAAMIMDGALSRLIIDIQRVLMIKYDKI